MGEAGIYQNEAGIYGKLTGIFREVMDDDGLALSPGLTSADVEEWDSIAHIRLMITIEEIFDIKFSASEIGRLENVGQLVGLINSKLGARPAV